MKTRLCKIDIEKILQLWDSGDTIRNISKKFRLSYGIIHYWLRKNNRRVKKFQFTDDLKKQIVEMRARGLSVNEISTTLHCRINIISQFCKKHNVFYSDKLWRERLKNRGRSTRWHFSDEQKKDIKQLRLSGIIHKDIAARFNVPTYVISYLCNKTLKVFPIKEIILEGYARCSRCNEIKPKSEFSKNKNNTIKGIGPYCRKCKSEYWLKYVSKPGIKEKREERKKIYKNNPEIKKRAMERQRELRKTDIKFKLNDQISSSIRHSLYNNKNGYHWEKLVGYTLNDLMNHLQKQFVKGMTWENYGKKGWTIDHIIPISAFNFEKATDIDFHRCWALENLRPLWHQGPNGNISKSNKLEHDFQPFLTLEIA